MWRLMEQLREGILSGRIRPGDRSALGKSARPGSTLRLEPPYGPQSGWQILENEVCDGGTRAGTFCSERMRHPEEFREYRRDHHRYLSDYDFSPGDSGASTRC
ncbi:MAG: hypothetical protein ACLRT5_09480 [Lachnospiraceae bacterium]